MSMGSTLTLYKASPHKVKQLVANLFEMPAQVLESWLLCLNTVRKFALTMRDFGIANSVSNHGYPSQNNIPNGMPQLLFPRTEFSPSLPFADTACAS